MKLGLAMLAKAVGAALGTCLIFGSYELGGLAGVCAVSALLAALRVALVFATAYLEAVVEALEDRE